MIAKFLETYDESTAEFEPELFRGQCPQCGPSTLRVEHYKNAEPVISTCLSCNNRLFST